MAKHQRAKIRRYHISAKYRDYFTSNLALLLGADVPVQEAFDSLKETSRSAALNKALDQMKYDIDEGMPLWKAMDRAGVVGSQTLALMHLGEESGRLVENLKVASRQESKQRVFRSKVRSAMLYPTFVLSLTGLVGIGVAWFLLPRLAETFTQLGTDLPLISRIFINAGLFLKANGLWAVPLGLSVIAMLGIVLFGLPKTRVWGLWLLFHVPGVSRLLHEVEIARFGYLLGTLLEAGLSITQSLQSLKEATNVPKYKQFYQELSDAIEDGFSFRKALPRYSARHKLLPPAIQQMIIAGEQSGSLATTLKSIGEIYEEKSDTTTQNLEVILEPILLIIVWFGVIGVAVAVILPIYSLVGGLGGV